MEVLGLPAAGDMDRSMLSDTLPVRNRFVNRTEYEFHGHDHRLPLHDWRTEIATAYLGHFDTITSRKMEESRRCTFRIVAEKSWAESRIWFAVSKDLIKAGKMAAGELLNASRSHRRCTFFEKVKSLMKFPQERSRHDKYSHAQRTENAILNLVLRCCVKPLKSLRKEDSRF